MARLVDFEPDASGEGYLFHKDDGSEPLYAWGPDADALAADIERTRPPDLRTAQAGGGGAGGSGGLPAYDTGAGGAAGEGGYAAPPPPPERPVAGQPEIQSREVPPLMKKVVPVAVQGPQAIPTLPVQGPAPEQAPTQPELGPAPPIRVAGSPAVTREQIAKKSISGVGVPQTISREITDAQPYDDLGLSNRTELEGERRGLAEELAQRDSARARAQELQYASQLPALEMQAAEQNHVYQTVRNEYERDRADLDGMISQHREKQVDPGRWWHSMSTGSQVATVISQALGAFAATLSGGENWAQKQIDQISERDIAAQQADIDKGGADVNNALAMLQRKYGDVEQAKAGLRLALHDVAGMEREEMLAHAKSEEAIEANRVWDLEYQEKREELEQKFRDASIGKHTTKIAEKVEFPRRASGGGTRPRTEAEEETYWKREANKAASKAQIRGGGVDPDTAATAGGKQAAKATELTIKYGESKRTINESRTAIANYARTLDKYKDKDIPATGITAGLYENLPPDATLAGPRNLVRRGLRTNEGEAVKQEQDAVVSAFIKATSGTAASDTEVERLRNVVIGPTDATARRGIEFMQQQLDDQERALDKSYGPNVVGQYEQQGQKTDVHRVQRSQGSARDKGVR